jgi:hypothetical protein
MVINGIPRIPARDVAALIGVSDREEDEEEEQQEEEGDDDGEASAEERQQQQQQQPNKLGCLLRISKTSAFRVCRAQQRDSHDPRRKSVFTAYEIPVLRTTREAILLYEDTRFSAGGEEHSASSAEAFASTALVQ